MSTGLKKVLAEIEKAKQVNIYEPHFDQRDATIRHSARVGGLEYVEMLINHFIATEACMQDEVLESEAIHE